MNSWEERRVNLSCEYLGDDASASDFGVGEPLRAAVVGEIQASVIEARRSSHEFIRN